MVSVLLDVRRARQRRTTLVALSVAGLALPIVALLAPAARVLLATPSPIALVLSGGAVLAASVAAVTSGREAHWSTADDVAWALGLVALAVSAGVSQGPVPAALVLHALAVVLLGVRVPPGRMIVAASLSAMLPMLLRVLLRRPVTEVAAALGVSVLSQTALTFLARATHSLAYVLAERENLLAERKGAAARARERRERREVRDREDSPAVLAAPKLFQPARSALLDAKDDDAGWEGLVERVRSSVSALCEPVGVEAVVHAELQGLAPPSSKLRQHVLKIAQEAAANALRESAPRSLAITLRRADGGLLMEFVDDGEETEAARARRGVAGLKGRVTPLGGSAELRRADDGWLVRVKLPCEQLN
jgi:signal transduction histidine kinase